MRKSLIFTFLAAVLLFTVAGTAHAQKRYVGYSGYSEKPVAGAEAMSYVLRARYVLPANWRTSKPASAVLTRRFGPVGSCRIRVTVTGRAIADADETAAARVARLLPAGILADEGTRGNAAWRVVRERGGARTVIGLLVKPAPTVRTPPPGKRVWIELRAVGLIDQKVECHSGGPRTTADAFGDMLAGARLGGFQPR